ncbi:DNA-binding transcriptional regulator, GntR family [Mycolicibacterium rutilum]|uniref:DNA-binding transcriptional regulator, GntR family n=1 Tax=Mycolicibacterium rutilum TaxID=370526 RepID=A0A1H6IWZ7_MYCRU|nr:GntR family transcriptional regulator [Mycolicibacterium rutilum]SEH54021.1 DNA-binding transcriptional regulator, GntR family [Mycolicibacterium rutilum]
MPVRSTLVDQVYERLMELLLDGTLHSGDPISIDGTARHLGVSPTPVREALARLESTGNVVRVAMRGYRVPEMPGAKEIADIMDARLLIESHLAELACTRADSEFLAALETAIEDQARAPHTADVAAITAYHRADERFHRLIAEHADNDALLRAYDALGGHGQRFRLFVGVGVKDAEHAIAEHRTILAALRRGYAPEVYRTMHTHINGVKARALAEHAQAERGAQTPDSGLAHDAALRSRS